MVQNVRYISEKYPQLVLLMWKGLLLLLLFKNRLLGKLEIPKFISLTPLNPQFSFFCDMHNLFYYL